MIVLLLNSGGGKLAFGKSVLADGSVAAEKGWRRVRRLVEFVMFVALRESVMKSWTKMRRLALRVDALIDRLNSMIRHLYT